MAHPRFWKPFLYLTILFLLAACKGNIPGESVLWTGTEDAATASPDGKHIAFVDWDTGNLGLYNLQTESYAPGTDKGDWSENGSWVEGNAVFSPDGGTIAFSYANVLECEPFCYELRTTTVADTEMNVLFKHLEPSQFLAPFDWREDTGILILVTNSDHTWSLILVDPSTGSTETLMKDTAGRPVPGYGRFAHGGRSVIYHADDGLWGLDRTSGKSSRLDLPAISFLGWDPASSSVVYTAREEAPGIYATEVNEEFDTGQTFMRKREDVALVPAGAYPGRINYVRTVDAPALYLADVNLREATAGSPSRLSGPSSRTMGNPAWSNDGRRIAFTMESYGVDGQGMHLMVSDADDWNPRPVGEVMFGLLNGMDWSPDDSYLYFSGRGDYYMTTGDSSRSSWTGRINVATGEVAMISPDAVTALDVGPDGALVYQKAYEPGMSVSHIMRIEPEGGSPRTLLDLPKVSRSLSVSPDGAKVAFVQPGEQPGSTALRILQADGSVRTLAEWQRPRFLSVNQGSLPWTPDGRHLIVYGRDESSEGGYLKMSVDDGSVRFLGLQPAHARSQPALHPNGKRLVYVDGLLKHEMVVLGPGR